MKPTAHILTSAAFAAGLYLQSHSAPEAATCFLSGVFIDLDHFLDFFLFSGERFTIRTFFSWCHDARWQKLALIFHSYELYGALCILALFVDSAAFRGLLLGAGLHLFFDQIVNKKRYGLSPWFYFLGYRIAVGFRKEKLRLLS